MTYKYLTIPYLTESHELYNDVMTFLSSSYPTLDHTYDASLVSYTLMYYDDILISIIVYSVYKSERFPECDIIYIKYIGLIEDYTYKVKNIDSYYIRYYYTSLFKVWSDDQSLISFINMDVITKEHLLYDIFRYNGFRKLDLRSNELVLYRSYPTYDIIVKATKHPKTIVNNRNYLLTGKVVEAITQSIYEDHEVDFYDLRSIVGSKQYKLGSFDYRNNFLDDYYNILQLKQNGWTDDMIHDILPKEDYTDNKYKRYWKKSTIDKLMDDNSYVFKGKPEQALKDYELMIDEAMANIKVEKVSLDIIYNNRPKYLQYCKYDDPRVGNYMVNYIRHGLTNYEVTLAAMCYKYGFIDAYNKYKRAVLNKIKEVYPSLTDYCIMQSLNTVVLTNRIKSRKVNY